MIATSWVATTSPTARAGEADGRGHQASSLTASVESDGRDRARRGVRKLRARGHHRDPRALDDVVDVDDGGDHVASDEGPVVGEALVRVDHLGEVHAHLGVHDRGELGALRDDDGESRGRDEVGEARAPWPPRPHRCASDGAFTASANSRIFTRVTSYGSPGP